MRVGLCAEAPMLSRQNAVSIVKRVASSDTLKCEEGSQEASERECSVGEKNEIIVLELTVL